MSNYNKFSAVGKTKSFPVTATVSTSKSLPSRGNNVRIVNEGPNVAFIHISSGAAVATLPHATTPVATSTPCYLGETILSLPFEMDTTTPLNMSAICRATETAELSVQVGEGV